MEDVDKTAKQALAAGATLKKPVEDQFYGDRSGTVADPFGHVWYISTHIEDMSDDEMQRRSEAMMKKHAEKEKQHSLEPDAGAPPTTAP